MTHAPLAMVADIGGTHSRIAIAQGVDIQKATLKRYVNADFVSPTAMIKRFLRESWQPHIVATVGTLGTAALMHPQRACFAIAGPVDNNVAKLTNRDWVFDTNHLAKISGVEQFILINDLTAQAAALDTIKPQSVRTVIKGTQAVEQMHTTRLVVGAGTGLNAAVIYGHSPINQANQANSLFHIGISECGHISLPSHIAIPSQFFDQKDSKNSFVSFEDIISGRGLHALYTCFAPPTEQGLTGAEIIRAAQTKTNPAAERSVCFIAKAFGCFVGDLALVHLPITGIYLIGGLARAVVGCTDAVPLFKQGFYHKGRFENYMQRFDVAVIDDDFAGLKGAASALLHRF